VFFDTTPLGRVLARFSKDVDAIDNQIAMQLGMLGMSVFFLIGSLAAIIFSTPWFAVTIPVFIIVDLRVMNVRAGGQGGAGGLPCWCAAARALPLAAAARRAVHECEIWRRSMTRF